MFNTNKGYCTYFATSSLFMLRSLGIPSRVAVGFMTVDRSYKTPGWYWFYADQAHAWTQVYIPEYGWLDFDMTVGAEGAEQAPQPDGTPPTPPTKETYVGKGVIKVVDTINKKMKVLIDQMIVNDNGILLDSTSLVTMNFDVNQAKVFAGEQLIALKNIQLGDTAVMVSFDYKLSRIRKKSSKESIEKYIKRFPDPLTIMEVHVPKIKEEKLTEPEKEDEEKAQQQLNAISFGGSFGGGSAQSTNNQGNWYFYNNQALSFGEAEFQKTWGNRPLEDNWRWSEKQSTTVTVKDSAQVKQKLKRYELATYLKDIPTSKEDISDLKLARQEALFQLGLIYKEQFKNNQLAISNLENLLASNPQEKYILPANYHLYLLHKETDDSKANVYKNKILKDYSETVYAQIILNPNKDIQKEEATSELETKYKEIYYLYKENKFQDVINEIDKVIYNDNKSILIPKFELLKAFAIGKYQDKDSYKKAMELVAIRYAGTDEGKKAKEIVKKLN